MINTIHSRRNLINLTNLKEIELRMGGGMIDVELDPEHYELAIQQVTSKFQRAENAVEESLMILELLEGKSEYTLPEEVMEVKDIYRRTTGVSSGTGNDIESGRYTKYIFVR